jgi:DNA repair protein RecO (recombination protein O)
MVSMPPEKASAIVIRRIDFSESSLILTLFTREFGKIAALAKGAKRPKGPFESALDLLSRCRIVFLPKSGGGLDLLTEAKLEHRFRTVGRDVSSLFAAYYVAELLLELTHDYDPHPTLFDEAIRTLSELMTPVQPGRLILRFELVALGMLGHLPALEACANCGNAINLVGSVAFGLREGGLLCAECRRKLRQGAVLTAGSVRTLKTLADTNSEVWQRTEMDRKTWSELRGIMSRYLTFLLGKKLRLWKYLRLNRDG